MRKVQTFIKIDSQDLVRAIKLISFLNQLRATRIYMDTKVPSSHHPHTSMRHWRFHVVSRR